MIEDFTVVDVVALPPDLTNVCATLGKKQPRQDVELQFTRANWLAIRNHPEQFREFGVQIWLPPGLADR